LAKAGANLLPPAVEREELAMVALLKMPNRITPDEANDRRVFVRKPANQSVEGLRIDHTVTARQQPRLTLHLRDLSLGGLSALSETPLLRNECVAVSFPRQGLTAGWSAVARVLRCEPSAMGYRIAMEFDALRAA